MTVRKSLLTLSADELHSLGGLKEYCSARLHCGAHGLAIPCAACNAEGNTGVVCSACGHHFAEGLARASNRACQSEMEFSRSGKIAFEAEANAALQTRESGRPAQEEAQRHAIEQGSNGISLESLSVAELVKLEGLKERCSAPLRCEKHGLAVPCELCDVEGSTGIVCSACGHYFAEGLASGSDRPCQSVAEFSRTGKIAFADSANEAVRAQESERQRQEEIQREATELARLKRERVETERAEAERREQLERERVRREKADSERREQVERERLDRERSEAEYREQVERERVQKEHAEAERQRQIERKGFERKVGAGVWVVLAIATIWYLVGTGSKEKQTSSAVTINSTASSSTITDESRLDRYSVAPEQFTEVEACVGEACVFGERWLVVEDTQAYSAPPNVVAVPGSSLKKVAVLHKGDWVRTETGIILSTRGKASTNDHSSWGNDVVNGVYSSSSNPPIKSGELIPVYGTGGEGCYRTVFDKKPYVICNVDIISDPGFQSWVKIIAANGLKAWVWRNTHPRAVTEFKSEGGLLTELAGNIRNPNLALERKIAYIDDFLRMGGNLNGDVGRYGMRPIDEAIEMNDLGLIQALKARGAVK